MRRSSFIQLTLLPILASARLIHADPDPTPTGAPGYGPPGDQTGEVQPQPAYSNTYIGPDGTVVLLPPGMTQVVPVEAPCDEDPDQPRCRPVSAQVYWHNTYRGGFGSFFGGHGGWGGHGGHGGWGG